MESQSPRFPSWLYQYLISCQHNEDKINFSPDMNIFCQHPASLSFRAQGEGNGTRLQYFCLENPMDRRAWWAAVHGVAKLTYLFLAVLSLHCCVGTVIGML